MIAKFTILAQVCSVVAILAAEVCLNDGPWGAATMVRLSCVALQIQLVWMLASWRWTGGELFSPYCLFLIAVFVFNASQGSLEILGLNRNGLLNGQLPESTVAQTLLFVLYALSLMHLGALVAAATAVRRESLAMPNASTVNLRRVAVVLFVAALIPTILVWKRALDLVAQGGYMALYQADLATGFGAAPTVLSGFLVPSGFLLLAGAERRRRACMAACFIIGSYVLVQLFLGFRGQAVAVLVAFLWLWHRRIRPVPLMPLLALAVVTLAFVLPVIGVTRVAAGRERMSFSTLKESYAAIESPAVSILYDMGGTMITSAYTIQLVPSRHGYEFGGSYAYAMLSLVPNVFWPVHPAATHSPSKWLVSAAEPERAMVFGGLGYSVIAEAFLNFGFIGAGVPMGLIGLAVGRLSRWAQGNRSPSVIAFAAIQLVSLLIYARAETGEVIRGLTWYVAVPYLLVNVRPRPFSAKSNALSSSDGNPTGGELRGGEPNGCRPSVSS